MNHVDPTPNTEAAPVKTLAVVITKVHTDNPNECWTQTHIERIQVIDFYRGNPC